MSDQAASRRSVPTAVFGRTGHASSRVIFGAAALGSMGQEAADRVLQTLVEFGVSHIDTAADYGDSELRVGGWMAGHRDEWFLATKTGERDGVAARASLERSLVRLGVDHLDMIQLHNLVEEDEWATAHGPGGAVEALARARDEGLVRYVGVTGHGLRIAGMHARSLEMFDFDSVLLPYNAALLNDAGYRDEVEALFATCRERGVAIQTIKSMARRRWADDASPRHSWYEPIAGAEPIGRATRWLLGHDDLFLNSSSDTRLLRPTLEAACTPGPIPSEEDMAADLHSLGIQPLFDWGALERI